MNHNQNWAGNYTYNANSLQFPENVEQVQEAVANSNRVKVLGTRHSFNEIADTEGVHLSLQKMNRVIALDTVNNRVTVEAGIRYGDLGQYLHSRGYALHNLASLPHITVVGACATATHGSGVRNGNLATAVQAMEVVISEGDKVIFSRDQQDGDIEGAAVGLGGLGVVTAITLDVTPAFQVCQYVYENLPLGALEKRFDDICSSAYSVSLFTDWKKGLMNQVWVKRKVTESDPTQTDSDFYGAKRATSRLHPVPGQSAENCSEQLGIPGPAYERLPHFRMEFTPSAGEELQSEYFVDRRDAYDALCAVDQLREHISPLLYVSEIRTIAQDNLWMSPCYKRDSVGIHFTWQANWEAVRQVLPMIEQALEPFAPRPHWGKLFTMSPDRVKEQYEKLPKFCRLLNRCDPQGKFRNDFLNRFII